MNLLFVALIVVIVILITKNKDLKSENDNLKIDTYNRVNFCPKCGHNFRNSVNRVNFCPSCGHNFVPLPRQNNYINEKDSIVKEKYTDKEIKNSLILIIGSVLVVLASIIFLTSTWNIIHNVVKIGVLIFMLAVFLAISYMSDKYLNLKQTSKSFYYIALSYIPIILLSISIFELFGNYLSLYGDGTYIYLTISSILVSLIYYFSSKKRNSKTIFIFSIIFQLLSVSFFTLMFISDTSIIFIGLLIYNILINLLYINDKVLFDKRTHLILSSTICISVSMLLISHSFINMIFNNIDIFDVISNVLLLINTYLLLTKIYNKDKIYNFIYPLLIILIFNNAGYIFDNMMFRQALILASFAVIYIYSILRENKINIVAYIETLAIFSAFNIFWMLIGIVGIKVFDGYILYSIITFLSLINYIYTEDNKLFSSIMFTIGIVITTFSLIVKFDLPVTIVGYLTLIFVLLSMILKNIDKSLRKALKLIGIISLIFITMINFSITIWDVLLYLVLFISTMIYGIKNKDNLYKIISYAYVNVFLFSIMYYTKLNFTNYIIPVTTIIFTLVEGCIPTIKSKATDSYLLISFIISFIVLGATNNIYGFILALILTAIFAYYVIHYEKSRNNLIVPLMGLIPYLYFSSIFVINSFNVMYIFSFIALTLICTLIYTKKSNLYITMFFVYTFFHIICLEQFKYIGIFILIMGGLICYLVKNNKVKDIYKSLLYVLGLILYNFIIIDLSVSNMTSLNTGIYIIFTLLLTRTIFKKYGNGYKVWEYVLCVLINLIALGNYISEYDGLIYVIFLTIIVIISYILKYGPTFLICLIAIVINMLLLTREFWLSLPWWLYILSIGSVLIGFAVYNEVKDKNKDNRESLKDKLDL